MAKTANVYARIEPDLKERAEAILASLGVPSSTAISMFYQQIVLQAGLPFPVRLPATPPVDARTLTDEQLDAIIEEGYADVRAGRTRSAESVFAEFRRDYQL